MTNYERFSIVCLAVLLLCGICTAGPVAFAAPVPDGVWKEPGSGLLVRTHPCENESSLLCGTITAVPPDVEEIDVHNPEPELRNRPLLDLEILRDFEAVGLNRWQGGGDYGRRPGRIYLPLNGDTLGDHKNRYEIVVEKNQLIVQVADCRFLECLNKSVWERRQ